MPAADTARVDVPVLGVDQALAYALAAAARAERRDVVSQLARELEARRLAGSNVVTLKGSKGSSRG